MEKRTFRKFSMFASLLMVFQLAIPMGSTFAATTTKATAATTVGTGSMLPPGNLASQLLTPDDVKLTWSTVFGATGYNVYSITDGSLQLLGKVTTNSYTMNNLPEGSYSYVVSTLTADGESGPCAPINVDINYPDMAAPTALTKSITNGNDVVLNWGASQYAESYKVYQIGSDGQQTLLNTGTARTYTISNAPAGSYTYAVSAVNSLYGESPLSTSVSVDVTVPTMTAPTGFSFTVTNGNDLNLKWNTVTYANSYNVYQVVDGQKNLIKNVTGTSTTLPNTLAGDYVYEVHSVSTRYGESTDGSQLPVSIGSVTMAAPGNFTSKVQNVNDIVLTWSSVPNATGYKVYQIIDGQPVLKSTVTGTTVTYTNQPSGDYTFEVHSNSDRFGESADGSQVSLTLGDVTMAAPDNFAYKLQNGNDVVLTWGTVANATSYKVYQVVNGVKTLKSTVTSPTVTYTNQAAGDYVYEVHSVSTKFGESADGAQVSLTMVLPVMQAPTGLVQTIKNATDFTLNWDAAAYATSYKVYQIVNGSKVLKATVSTTSTSFTGMSPGDYTYEVHSVSSRYGESTDGTQLTFTLNGQTMQPPTNLTYTAANINDITLKWTAATYATSYKVYQVIDGQKVLKSTVTGTSVTYSNLPGGDYDYVVDSVSTLLGESPTGAEVTFSLVLPTMVAPANLTSKVQNGNDVVLTWATALNATSYKVYELVGGQEVLVKTATGLTATISNVPAGDHTYVVHSSSTRYGDSSEGSQVSQTVAQ
ncbi:MAG: OmpL47-type beta-barrel domain-containing protein, partial [Tumebacillaceae bacterium]